MQKQLLWIMYIISRDDTFIRIPPRETRSAMKIVFKIPAKIMHVNENSPYYQGTNLWNGLEKETQKKDNIFAFKKDIERHFKCYKRI